MAGNSDSSPTRTRKKVNLLDHHAIKHALDETVIEIVKSRSYVEDVRLSNVRLILGGVLIIMALMAQFYPKKFPANMGFLIGCIILYIIMNGLLQLLIHIKEKDAILFTYPPSGSYNSTGLVVSSKLPRYSDLYTLRIRSADPKSLSANKPVEFSKSVTEWFTKDGVLVEGLVWKDVQGLIDQYAQEPRKGK